MKEKENAAIEKQLDLIAAKVVNMVTQDEFRATSQGIDSKVDQLQTAMATMVTRDEYLTSMDELLTIVRRLDQERIFTLEWVRRIEGDVERIKKHLHLT